MGAFRSVFHVKHMAEKDAHELEIKLPLLEVAIVVTRSVVVWQCT